MGKGSKRIDLDHFLQFCKLALVLVMDMLPEILLCYTMLLYSFFVQAITLVSDSGFVQFTYFVVYKGKWMTWFRKETDVHVQMLH